jgi:type IV pilus assembly protein PilA
VNSETSLPTEALYRAAVGAKRADFYVPKFLLFDVPGARRVSWNWPALFVPFYWGLYRRMYGPSVIYCILIPAVFAIVFATIDVFVQSRALAWLFNIGLGVYEWIMIPMYANSLYHRTVVRRIREVQARVPDPAVQIVVLENAPHTSALAWVIVCFMFIPLFGILAAIAIPAYQDYTVRSQVTEGLMLAGPLENAVGQALGASGSWPADLAAAKFAGPVSGSYVADIRVDKGTISIRFGNRANSMIANQVLSLRPTVEQRQVSWSCGYTTAAGTDPTSGASGPDQTTVRKNYLPSRCRG